MYGWAARAWPRARAPDEQEEEHFKPTSGTFSACWRRRATSTDYYLIFHFTLSINAMIMDISLSEKHFHILDNIPRGKRGEGELDFFSSSSRLSTALQFTSGGFALTASALPARRICSALPPQRAARPFLRTCLLHRHCRARRATTTLLVQVLMICMCLLCIVCCSVCGRCCCCCRVGGMKAMSKKINPNNEWFAAAGSSKRLAAAARAAAPRGVIRWGGDLPARYMGEGGEIDQKARAIWCHY